ncbi:MAG: LacI family transcriptional regulator [Chloroflexota bacterium]|nr:MAG: LacI family transcriptional regulator [Chloroflexota bacterium]
MMSSATMQDVAKRAGVSVATVSRVLNGSDKVIDETRERVLQACQELDYSLHLAAQRLRLGKTNTICVILPFLTLPSIVERLRGVQEALLDSGYDLIPFSVGSPEMRDSRLYDLANRSRTDGLLIISMPINDQQVERIINNDMPVVLIDSDKPEFSRVNVDDQEGGRIATEHLINLGHEKIAFISSHLENPLQFSSTLNRFHGYCKALDAAGIPINPEYQKEGEHGREEAEEMAISLLQQSDPPTAIFASSDTKAVGVLDAAKTLNIKVPEQLSVIGYDNIRDAEFLDLTTIQQPLYQAGLLGGKTLLQRIEQPKATPEEIILPVDLVIRKTTAPQLS